MFRGIEPAWNDANLRELAGHVTSPLFFAHIRAAHLVQSGVITDPGMMYFDIRPSDHLPTLELRICDACPRLEDVVLLAGLRPALEATGDWELVASLTESALARGSSAARQRAAYARGGLRKVVDTLLTETRAGPGWLPGTGSAGAGRGMAFGAVRPSGPRRTG